MSSGTLVRVPDISTNEIFVKISAQPDDDEGKAVSASGTGSAKCHIKIHIQSTISKCIFFHLFIFFIERVLSPPLQKISSPGMWVLVIYVIQ
jgi:hypothetical protein